MADWRPFGASNESNTCLWCGRRLHKETYGNFEKPGYSGDGYFCGLRCGYRFAETFAGLGRRLEPHKRTVTVPALTR